MKLATTVIVVMATTMQACATLTPAEFRTFQVNGQGAAMSAAYYGLPLRSGQLIASDSGAPDSLLIPLIGEVFTPLLHAGIIVVETDGPYVYEGYATLSPFGVGPPTDRMHGSIRRTPLSRYLRRQRIVAIYDAPGVTDPAAVADFARARMRDQTPFDPYFDWGDHSRLYCTEFVALALHAGGAPLPTPVPVRDNASLRIAFNWLGITAADIITVRSMVGESEPAALLSRRYSIEQVRAHFAAKEELHRRFVADQKLGNVWSWSWLGLRIRPHVEDFLNAARARPGEDVAELARQMLGPGPTQSGVR